MPVCIISLGFVKFSNLISKCQYYFVSAFIRKYLSHLCLLRWIFLKLTAVKYKKTIY